MLKEFREFAMRGNVVDMAVGVIIGLAFGRIVSSLVEDVLMPPIGLLTARVDFGNLYINLGSVPYDSLAAAEEAGAAVIRYGAFVNSLVHFLIVAFAAFLVVRSVNTVRRRREAPPREPTTKKCRRCLFEIPVDATRCGFCTTDV